MLMVKVVQTNRRVQRRRRRRRAVWIRHRLQTRTY